MKDADRTHRKKECRRPARSSAVDAFDCPARLIIDRAPIFDDYAGRIELVG